MDVIIDTSAIIAVIANEPEKSAITKITKGARLYAPSSIKWEVGNAFSAMLKRERINIVQAIKAIEIYGKITIDVVDVDLIASLNIADKYNIYAYDAYIIQCALQYNMPLISLDKTLLINARNSNIDILEVI